MSNATGFPIAIFGTRAGWGFYNPQPRATFFGRDTLSTFVSIVMAICVHIYYLFYGINQFIFYSAAIVGTILAILMPFVMSRNTPGFEYIHQIILACLFSSLYWVVPFTVGVWFPVVCAARVGVIVASWSYYHNDWYLSLISWVLSTRAGRRFAMFVGARRLMSPRSIAIILWAKLMVDWALFLGVAAAVYCTLRWRKNRNQNKYEALFSEYEKDGNFTSKKIMRLCADAVKIGVIAGAIGEGGLAFVPKQYRAASLAADLLRAISDAMPDFRELVDGDEEDEDDEPDILDWATSDLWTKLGRLKTKVMDIVFKHRGRISIIVVGSILGAMLFFYAQMKQRRGSSWLPFSEKKTEVVAVYLPDASKPMRAGTAGWHYRKLESKEQYFSGRGLVIPSRVFEREAKGKNKGGGKGAVKTHLKKFNGKKHKTWIQYDNDDEIVEMWVNGEPVDKRDYIGKSLTAGLYEIYKVNEWGQTVLADQFQVGDMEDVDDLSRTDKYGREAVSDSVKGLESLVLKRFESHAGEMTQVNTNLRLMTDRIVELLERMDRIETQEHWERQANSSKIVQAARDLRQEVAASASVTKPQKEALVAGASNIKIGTVQQALGKCIDKDGVAFSSVVPTNRGLLINTHSVSRTVSFEFGGKKFVPEKVEVLPIALGHNDLSLVALKMDGVPVLAKKNFSVPEVNQSLSMVTPLPDSKIAPGQVLKLDAGPEGLDVVANITTAPGDCGSPYLNANGHIVAIHYSEGDKNLNNRGIAITTAMLDKIWASTHQLAAISKN